MDTEQKIVFLGVKIDAIRLPTLLEVICQSAVTGRRVTIEYVNIYALNLAHQEPWFREFLNRCEITYCDGIGAKLGADLLGLRLPQRMTPPDWLSELARLCVENDFTLYLLGSRPGIAEKAAHRLSTGAPGLRVVGAGDGYFEKTPGCAQNRAVVDQINAAQPDILLVGFGMPLQERWLAENRDDLEAKVVLLVGAAFDYLSGETWRAPRWMTDRGLEWLGRLVIEPGRLWKRYLIGIPLFIGHILQDRLRRNPRSFPG